MCVFLLNNCGRDTVVVNFLVAVGLFRALRFDVAIFGDFSSRALSDFLTAIYFGGFFWKMKKLLWNKIL